MNNIGFVFLWIFGKEKWSWKNPYFNGVHNLDFAIWRTRLAIFCKHHEFEGTSEDGVKFCELCGIRQKKYD